MKIIITQYLTTMEPKESKSNRHFTLSILKSGVRLFAGIILATSGVAGIKIVGVLLIVAEMLGVAEEL